MNWMSLKGTGNSSTGKAKEQWGKLTDDHLDMIAGSGISLRATWSRRYLGSDQDPLFTFRRWFTIT